MLLLLVGCSGKYGVPEGNAVYYWRSSFELSDAEKEFLKENDIKTFYVKFFDIVENNGQLKPEATLQFTDSFPEKIEIVPTVFIDSKVLDRADMPDDFARMIVARIDSMTVKNGYPLSGEIQIDFDWTSSNRQKYYHLLSRLREMLHQQDRRLSTTIRLHQLRQEPPPVDYGSLMLYNTGSMVSPRERNSILSTTSVEPYLKDLKGYSLPMVTAFPVYSWNLIFHEDEFMVIARNIEYADTALFEKTGDNIYRARRYMPIPSSSSGARPGARILPGDMLRHEMASYEVIDSVASAIYEMRPDILKRVIIYHLDEKSIDNYKKDEIKKIFDRP